MKIILSILIAFLFVKEAHTQDIGGAPLPTVIPQEVHDLILGKAKEGECIQQGNTLLSYYHWLACGHSLDALWAEIFEKWGRVRTALTHSCGKLYVARVSPGSLPDGFVWKARSERSGKPVMLLPSSYFNKVNFVDITNIEAGFTVGDQLDIGDQRGQLQNDNRTHFDFRKFATQYSREILIVLKRQEQLSTGEKLYISECIYLTNPTEDLRK